MAVSSLIPEARRIQLDVAGVSRTDGLLIHPPDAKACFVFAHGAGAGMTHPSMATFADALATRGIATLRYQFPYMQRGSRRPDIPATCHATVRAAVNYANSLGPELPLIAGGRSFGGRMTSQAQASGVLPGVRGLAFLAFPLHAPRKPSDARAAHLDAVDVPMLFLQGTRDELASLDLLEPVVNRLGSRATLHLVDGADHSFRVLARSGRKEPDVQEEMLSAFVAWTLSVVGGEPTQRTA
jgi:uncharacterized protein